MKGLYLGSQEAAADRDELEKRGITHILNVVGGEPIYSKVI